MAEFSLFSQRMTDMSRELDVPFQLGDSKTYKLFVPFVRLRAAMQKIYPKLVFAKCVSQANDDQIRDHA